jgi:hypothetical protein
MKYILFLPLLACACGGSAFSTGDIGDAGKADTAEREDSGRSPDVMEPVDSGMPAADTSTPDSATLVDSSTLPDTLPDTSMLDTAPADDTCVPIPPSTVQMGMLCNGQATQASYQVPAQFILDQQGCLTPLPTPAACRCAGQYTCACINFNPGVSVSCSIQDGVVVFTGN